MHFVLSTLPMKPLPGGNTPSTVRHTRARPQADMAGLQTLVQVFPSTQYVNFAQAIL
jgi:hypothetical protein